MASERQKRFNEFKEKCAYLVKYLRYRTYPIDSSDSLARNIRRRAKSHIYDEANEELYYTGGKEGVRKKVVVHMDEAWDKIRLHHCTLTGEHRGMNATIAKVYQSYIWKGIKQDITDYVKSCAGCKWSDKRKPQTIKREPQREMNLPEFTAGPGLSLDSSSIGLGSQHLHKCMQCPQMFSHRQGLLRHVREKHSTTKFLHCKQCSYRSTHQTAMMCHYQRCHEDHMDEVGSIMPKVDQPQGTSEMTIPASACPDEDMAAGPSSPTPIHLFRSPGDGAWSPVPDSSQETLATNQGSSEIPEKKYKLATVKETSTKNVFLGTRLISHEESVKTYYKMVEVDWSDENASLLD